MLRRRRALIGLCLFLSGLASLIEEGIWHRYLVILLGAQARATAVTLALFLGGMSAGYLYFGARAKRSRAPGREYATVELALGIWALLFPGLFHLAFAALPWLFSHGGITSLGVDLGVALPLLVPPAFLMGASLPLALQAYRASAGEVDRAHARLYGLNTVGASVGALLTGYVLIPSLSLPTGSWAAGAINLGAALLLALGARELSVPVNDPRRASRPRPRLLAIALLSGFTVLTLETALMRLMGLATGASDSHFTLVAALFLLGLGAGGLLASFGRRLFADVSVLVFAQLAAFVALALLYLSGDSWSYAAHVLRVILRDVPINYFVYQALLALALALCVLPASALTGLTLPLLFPLLRESEDSPGSSVGVLYAANGVGCVLGALVGGYLLYHWLDLDQMLKLCCLVTLVSVALALGIARPRRIGAWTALAGLFALSVVVLPRYAMERFLQPFRLVEPMEVSFAGPARWGAWFRKHTPHLEWKDGPTASIGLAITEEGGREFGRSLFVNGKSDGNTDDDGFTAAMLGHLGALLTRHPERACVVGMGTGLTIGALAGYPEVKRIDVAEISETAIAHARFFDRYDGGVSRDRKVKFFPVDAFRFLGASLTKYDVIVSEPSNPWVSGVENLYTTELYERVKAHLTDDGIFVQWIHAYSSNDDLLRLVMNTMRVVFPETSVFQLSLGDLALVASPRRLRLDDLNRAARRLAEPAVAPVLARLGIDRIEPLLALQVAPPALVRAMSVGMGEQRLEDAHLAARAERALFVGDWARVLPLRRKFFDYYATLSDSLLALYEGDSPPPPAVNAALRHTLCDFPRSRMHQLCQEVALRDRWLGARGVSLFETQALPDSELGPFNRVLASRGRIRSEAEADALDAAVALYRRYASPIVRLPFQGLLAQANACLTSVPRRTSVYGKCLLAKAELFETEDRFTPQFLDAVRKFLSWIPTLPPGAPDYARMERARRLLVRALGTRR